MDDNELRALIEATTAPRVSYERIKEVQANVEYHRLTDVLTVCVITLTNGFTVTGESACASPANYDEKIGNEIAHRNAEAKIWALEGYLLKQRLHVCEGGTVPSKDYLSTYVGTKALHAAPMSKKDYCTLRGWEVPADEDGTEMGYVVEYADGGKPNVEGFTGYVSWSPADVFDRAYHKL